jgi:2-succinyl-6-hydroxy-2,4-cyclohexadiene-1-carboxylate synthase
VHTVLVPGFTQTAASWQAVLDALPEDVAARAIDVPLRETFAATAHAIGDAGGDAIYAGYPMGGRLCLRLALDRPRRVRALVLVSATPGIADPAARAERAEEDDALAAVVARDGVDAFLASWLARPMFAGVPPDAPGRRERHTLTAEYLAGSLRILGTGAMAPMWDELGALTMPVVVVSGTRDAKFDAIARDMRARLGAHATHVQLDGGHALPLEQPAALARVIATTAASLHVSGQ